MERKTVKPRANKDLASNINQVPVVRRKSEQNKPTTMSKRSTWLKIVLPITLAVVLVTSTVLAVVLASNKKYKVNFYIGDNLVCSQSIKDDVATPPTDEQLSNKIPEGYLIEGWYKDAYFSERFNFQEKITQKTNIYGKLVEDEEIYTISYNYTDGDGTVLSTEVVEGDTLPSEDRPTGTRTYYDFGGWGLNPTDTSSIEDDYIFTSSTTLYAIWNRKQVNISFSVGYVGSEETTTIVKPVAAGSNYVINMQDIDIESEYILPLEITVGDSPKELGDSIRIEEDNVTATVELDEYFLLMKDMAGNIVEKCKASNSLTLALTEQSLAKTKGTGEDKTYFTGWATSDDATQPTYLIGTTHEFTQKTTLYTVYEAGSYDDLSFTEISDATNGNYYSVGRNSDSSATRLIIPDNRLNLPVRAITSSAFMNKKTITNIYLPNSIEIIGNSAFKGCTSLTSINIPEGVTSIDYYAFYDCTGLTTINYNATNASDLESSTLAVFPGAGTSGDGTTINIGDNVMHIPARLFVGYGNIKAIRIGRGLESIGTSAFFINGGMESITISEDNLTYHVAGNCLIETATKKLLIGTNTSVIPTDGSVTSIEGGAFKGRRSLTNISIPEGVTSVGNSAFYGCESLTSISIPEGVTSVGNSTFWRCERLTSITIPDSVTSIGKSAFSYCRGLTSITIPDSVTSIGNGAFSNCNLTSITIGKSLDDVESVLEGCQGVTSITISEDNPTYHVGGNCLIETATKKLLLGTNTSVIPTDGSITSIKEKAFYNCSGLTSVTIPDSVTSIGSSAFSGCTGLTNIVIPDSVTSIGSSAFRNCTSLTTINYNATNLSDFESYANVFEAAGTSGDGITVNIGNNVTRIPAYLFCYLDINNNNESLQSDFFESNQDYIPKIKKVTIGNNVTSIGEGAFYACKFTIQEEEMTTDSNNWGRLGYLGNEGNPYLYLLKVVDNSYSEYSINESCKYIGDFAFAQTEGLWRVSIPNGVISIGYSAFYDCQGMDAIEIPDSVTSIGKQAFAFSGLRSISIPEGVTYIGAGAFWECYWATELNYNAANLAELVYDDLNDRPNAIFGIGQNCTIVIGEDVRHIPSYLFYGINNISSITMPNSVTSIGENIFYNCSTIYGLIDNEDYTLRYIGDNNNNNPYFYLFGVYDESASSYTIDDNCKFIGDYAFYECTGLERITIPNGVISIGYSAFSGCRGLASITIPDSVKSIGKEAFRGCTGLTNIVIPDSVTSIGNYAFSGCTGLTNIVIPDSVTSIGNYAFSGCTGLASITIPNGVISIGSSAFSGCRGLTSIDIPNSVTSIGSSAFSGCIGLTSIDIPDSVTSIGEYAFSGCRGLASITIPGSVTSIGHYTFSDCTSLTTINYNATNLSSCGQNVFYNAGKNGIGITINIGDNVTHIPENLFYITYSANVPKIIALTIGSNVTNIGSMAFFGCTGLTCIAMPDSVTSIGSSAFSGCTGLTSITIPNSVTSIGEYAFSDCTGLASITIPDSVTSIGHDAIPSTTNYILCANATVAGVVNDYMTTTNIYVANDGTYNNETNTGGVALNTLEYELVYEDATRFELYTCVIGDYTFVRTGGGTVESPYRYYINYALIEQA